MNLTNVLNGWFVLLPQLYSKWPIFPQKNRRSRWWSQIQHNKLGQSQCASNYAPNLQRSYPLSQYVRLQSTAVPNKSFHGDGGVNRTCRKSWSWREGCLLSFLTFRAKGQMDERRPPETMNAGFGTQKLPVIEEIPPGHQSLHLWPSVPSRVFWNRRPAKFNSVGRPSTAGINSSQVSQLITTSMLRPQGLTFINLVACIQDFSPVLARTYM